MTSLNSATTSSKTDNSQNVTIARRLITVAVSDFLCWFPIGVLGLAADRGAAIDGQVTVALAIFVLPLNSALNPFLYSSSLLAERARVRREAKLLENLQRLIASQSENKSKDEQNTVDD